MAKKFIRGVTGIEDIESYDKTLTNVNDIISDGQNTYVHTKKGKVESYYNLTDGVKEVKSTDDTLTIFKKDGTVSITNSGLATKQELAEKENVLSIDYGLKKYTSGNTTKLGLEYTKVDGGFDLNDFKDGFIRSNNFVNAPEINTWYFVSAYSEFSFTVQEAVDMLDTNNKKYKRLKYAGTWGPWREQVGDKSVIDALLAQKQNTITNNTSIGVSGNGLRQLYTQKQIYSVNGMGLLKTHVKSVSQNTSVSTNEDEFNFIVKIVKGVPSVNFTLNTQDTTKFTNIISAYGDTNTVRISGCVFTLSGSTLTVSTTNNTNQNYVITFSDII